MSAKPTYEESGQMASELKRTQKALAAMDIRTKIARLFLASPQNRLWGDILTLLLDEFYSQYGYIGYIDENGDLVRPPMARGVRQQSPVQAKNIVWPPKDWAGLWGESLKQKRSLLCNQNLTPPEGRLSLHNALIVPLIADQELVGQIALANKHPNYTRRDQNQLESLSKFIAPVLRLFLDKEKARKDLQFHARKLEERNIALNVLLENREEEKKKLADSILNNFERRVFPYYEKKKKYHRREDLLTILDIIETNTRESLALLERSVPSAYRRLTPMEIQVADLVKAGKSSKQIASLLNISPRSVFFHRSNIRKKMDIHRKNTNLRSLLLSLPQI